MAKDTKLKKFEILLVLVLQYDLTNRKTLQSHKLNYFIKQGVMFFTRSNSSKQYNTYH